MRSADEQKGEGSITRVMATPSLELGGIKPLSAPC